LGGFNKIAGMDLDEEQDEYSFNSKPIWARMLVIFAGSAMNFVLPIILFIIIFLGAGIDKPSDEAIIGSLITGKPAAQAGLASGDRVIAINGNSIDSWHQFVNIVRTSSDQINLTYERNGQTNTVAITPEYDPTEKRNLIGVVPVIINYRPGPGEAVIIAFQQTYAIGSSLLISIGQMITGQTSADLAGPVGVAKMAGEVAQLGIFPLLQFAAVLSINLGLANLLPVPALDGGHIVTLALEAVRGKPLSPNKMHFIQMVGFSLIMILILFVTFKDITRLKLF
jgi:regulator of sigma E protease